MISPAAQTSRADDHSGSPSDTQSLTNPAGDVKVRNPAQTDGVTLSQTYAHTFLFRFISFRLRGRAARARSGPVQERRRLLRPGRRDRGRRAGAARVP